jgi:hypothetical protein
MVDATNGWNRVETVGVFEGSGSRDGAYWQTLGRIGAERRPEWRYSTPSRVKIVHRRSFMQLARVPLQIIFDGRPIPEAKRDESAVLARR